MVFQSCAVACVVVGSPLMLVWMHDLQVCELKMLGCHSDLFTTGVTPEMNLKITQVIKQVSKRSTLALKLRVDVTRNPK